MKEFLECTALITGASAGIGREFALQLAPYAGTIILLARRTDRLEALRAELLRMNPGLRVLCETVDLADAAQVSAFCERLQADGSELDFLINNAGFGDAHAFEDAEWSKIERMLQVNIVALTALCHHLIPLLRRSRPGAILNVSSVASILPVPDLAVYAATKAYVSSFTEALRAELRGTGITVSQLCPGPVDTEFQLVARDGSVEGAGQPGSEWIKVTAADAARAGLRAVARDRARVFPGLAVQLVALGIGLTPLFILRYFLAVYHARTRKVVAKAGAIL
jgi:short-subunit dehydrogenase